MTRERWAQIAISIQFLVIVRSIAEIFRLLYVRGAALSAALAMPYVTGALMAACFCWAVVTLYFFRRYTLCLWIASASVSILLIYKVSVIGW